MKRHHKPRALAAAALAGALLGLLGAIPTARAADIDHHDRNCARGERRHERARDCDDRRDSDRRDHGDRGRWERFRHDDFGDCFRTPWGLACETDLSGVFLVRDRHPGDEPGPDCDLLIEEGWGWRCIDLPGR